MVGPDTSDELARVARDGQSPVPGVLLVASGAEPMSRLLAQGAIELTVGRRITTSTGRVVLDDGRMSREHAAIERVGQDWIVRDLASRNGTFVDGEQIVDQVQVRGDAVVRCGHSVFLLLADVRDHDRAEDIGAWIVGPELGRVLADVRRHGHSATLLVHGESGAGKGLVARHYHERGPRAAGRFVAVDCAALADGAAEAALFGSGHADTGYVHAAAGGTLLLDEIAELDLAAQARLVHAIDCRELPAGGSFDIGVVATSQHDLRGAVASRRLRNDLYSRLSQAVVDVPPLRHRRGDIPRFVVREIATAAPGLAAHPRLVEYCCVRPWPGNVRELQRVVRDAAITARAAGRDVVRLEDVAPGVGSAFHDEASGSHSGTGPRPKVSPTEVDRDAIEAALGASAGNVSAAARALGLHRTQLYRLLQRHGLVRAGDGTPES